MGTNRGGGRRPTPTHLAVVDKNHAYRHHAQPEPSKDWPVAPDYLSEPEKAIFDKLVNTISELYPPSASHIEMLALYAQNKLLAEFLDHQLRNVYHSTSYTTEDKNGNVLYKPYPEVQQLAVARKACMDILREFGLSPSSQRGVAVEKKKQIRNAFADLDEVNG
jgi:phage terminase small subunit